MITTATVDMKLNAKNSKTRLISIHTSTNIVDSLCCSDCSFSQRLSRLRRNARLNTTISKYTRMFFLPHSEDRMILSSFIWVGYQSVTDRQMDEWMELPWLIQRSGLQAMRPHCKNCYILSTCTEH